MKQKLKQWWNKFTKFQKYCIVITVWLINLTFYIMLPAGWYVLEAFHLIIACICGGIGGAIHRGDM